MYGGKRAALPLWSVHCCTITRWYACRHLRPSTPRLAEEPAVLPTSKDSAASEREREPERQPAGAAGLSSTSSDHTVCDASVVMRPVCIYMSAHGSTGQTWRAAMLVCMYTTMNLPVCTDCSVAGRSVHMQHHALQQHAVRLQRSAADIAASPLQQPGVRQQGQKPAWRWSAASGMLSWQRSCILRATWHGTASATPTRRRMTSRRPW